MMNAVSELRGSRPKRQAGRSQVTGARSWSWSEAVVVELDINRSLSLCVGSLCLTLFTAVVSRGVRGCKQSFFGRLNN